MSRRREPPPLVPPPPSPTEFGAGKVIGRRVFVRTAGGILVAASGLGAACADKVAAAVQQPPVPDPGKSTVTAAPSSIRITGTSTLTLQAKDASGAKLTTGGATVLFTASGGTASGTISSTIDHGDGTYTAVYTGTGAGTAQTIGATINGAAVTTTMPSVAVTAAAQAPDPTKCTVTAAPASISIGGTATLTLQAKTSSGANLTSGGAVVAFSAIGGTSAGAISATTDNGDGTYTAVYTGTAAGTAQTIGATINGAAVTTAMPTVTVTAIVAVPDPTKSTVTAAPATVAVSATATITLQAKDSTGANIGVGGATVTFSASGGTSTGTISAVTDNGNGTYTATFTATAAGTATTIGATLNGAAVTTTMPTLTVSAGGFQAPDIIPNFSFESGFTPYFNDGGAGQVSGAVIDGTLAYAGTHSAKYAFSPASGDSGATMYSEASGSYDRLWVRVYMRLTAQVTTTWKFIRFYNPSISGGGKGGIWIDGSTGNGIICVGWDEEDQAIITTIGLTQAQVIDGNWHSLEVDFQRNGGSTGFPEASFWWDGNPQYAEYNGHSTVNYYGSGNQSSWINGRINAGQRAASDQIAVIEWMGTLNGGNTASGQCNLDYVGVSSLGRIGP